MSLSILINAYACSPEMGSEPGMGWNWCVNLARYCELHIITEGEFRDKIEAVLPSLPQGSNMHFYYNPVSEGVRKMCWNQGDWRFYAHYRKWQKQTLEIARTIIENEHIDIVHQLNMVGFREPGYLWQIDSLPYVWGPIGGLKQFPTKYLDGASLKMQLFSRLKNTVNIAQIKYDPRVSQALTRASCLISSIPDSYEAIKKYKKLDSIVIPETGCYVYSTIDQNDRFRSKILNVVWVGKFDFRKQLPLALKAIAHANNKHIKLSVYGTGSDKQIEEAKRLANLLGVTKQVVWMGSRPNLEVLSAMQQADLFFFTSVSEDTSTVVLEAISSGLPVLCFNACGFGAAIDDKVGRKVELSDPTKSISDFASELNYLEENRDLLAEMSYNCAQKQQELSWENKAQQMVELYHQALNTEPLVSQKR